MLEPITMTGALTVLAKILIGIGSLFVLSKWSEKTAIPEIPLLFVWLGLMILVWLKV